MTFGQDLRAKWKGLICVSLVVAIAAFILAILGVQDEMHDNTGKNAAAIDELEEDYKAADILLGERIDATKDSADSHYEVLKVTVDANAATAQTLQDKVENGDIVTGVTKNELNVANVRTLEKVDDKIQVVQDKMDSLKAGSLNHNPVHITMVTHGHSDDGFWRDLVKPGFMQAVDDMHVFGTYYNPDDDTTVEDYKHMADEIASSAYRMVDGIAISIPDPDHAELKAAITTALDEPVPLVSLNSGLSSYDTFEAAGKYIKAHIGQDERVAGFEAGKKMGNYGVTKVKCIEHEANNKGLHERCENFCEGFRQRAGSSADCESSVHLWAKTNVEQEIQDLLEGDWDDVDGIMALGPSTADHIASALRLAAKVDDVKFATFDHTDHVLELIEDDVMEFAVDQCPYSQGYLPVVALALNAEIGTMLGAKGGGPGAPIYSGPSFIEKGMAKNKIGQDFSDISTATKQREDIFISFVTHGLGSREGFWKTVMKGARQAGLDLGIGRVEFHHPSRQARREGDVDQSYSYEKFKDLFDDSLSKNADGLAVAVTAPEVAAYMNEACTGSNSKPCVTLNSGMFDGLQDGGSFAHFGMEEFSAGAGAADQLVRSGYRKLYCIVHDNKNSGIVDRCAGAVKMFNCANDADLAHDSNDLLRGLSCADDRSDLRSEVVELLETNKVCFDMPSDWKCTDNTPGTTQDGSLDCGYNGVDCCQCTGKDGPTIAFTAEQYPKVLAKWYRTINADSETAILVTGGDMDKNVQDAIGDQEPNMAAFDCSFRALNYIVNGKIDFCVDQQPFLQGYMPVVFLTNAIQWGEKAGGGKPTFTGPAIVTSAEAPMVMLYAEMGYR